MAKYCRACTFISADYCFLRDRTLTGEEMSRATRCGDFEQDPAKAEKNKQHKATRKSGNM